MSDRKKKKASYIEQKPSEQNQSINKKENSLMLLLKRLINSANGQNLIIVFFVIMLYGNTLTGEYVLDDGMMIKENTFTKKGFDGIGDIFMHDSFTGISGSETNNFYTGSRYRPLSQVVFAIFYAIFGLNPFIGHLINIACYFIIGLILLKILNIFFAKQLVIAKQFHLPFIITLLYLAHPIHTEVVANIKSLDEILGMLFSLLALYVALKYCENNKKINLFLLVVFLLAGILSKENAITFCAIIPLSIFIIFENWKKFILPIAISLSIAIVAYASIRIAAIGMQMHSVESKMLFHNPFLYATSSEKYATIMLTWLKYFQLLIFPHPLTHDYYPKQIPIVNWVDFRVILSVIIYLIFSIFSILFILKKNIYAYAILFFLITFSVTSNLVFNLGLFMNERFMFMPSLGFSIICGYGLYQLMEKYKIIKKNWLIVILLVLVAYSGKTIHRNNAWLTGYGLFMTDIKTSTESGRCNVIVGSLLLEKARTDSLNSIEFLLQSEKYLKRGLEIWDGNMQGWGMLGEVNIRLGKLIEGRECYIKIFKEQPADIIALNNLNYISSEFIKQKNFKEARKTTQLMILQNPANQDYQLLNVEALLAENKIDSSLMLMENFLSSYPKSFKILNKIGELYGKYIRNIDKSIQYFEKAIEINPNFEPAYENLGIVYGMKGLYQKSAEYFEKAITLEPKNPNLYTNLAITYQNLNQKDKVENCFKMAQQIQAKNLK